MEGFIIFIVFMVIAYSLFYAFRPMNNDKVEDSNGEKINVQYLIIIAAVCSREYFLTDERLGVNMN